MGIIETARKIAKNKDAIPPVKIKEPDKMEALIQSLIKERNPLEIAIDIRLQKFYSSRILRASRYRGVPSLEVDTVFPQEYGRHALKTSEFLELSFNLKGSPYTFKSRFLHMGEDQFSTVIIAYPDIISFHQFRTAERFPIRLDDSPVFVRVKFRVHTNIMGKEDCLVEDISVDGLSFFTSNEKLAPGTDIRIDIEMSPVSHIETKATVMQMTDITGQEFAYECGIRFNGLSKVHREQIARFIQDEKKMREGLDDNVYDKERIIRLADHKKRIKARLEGREVTEEEAREMQDLLEFQNIELDESLDL